MAVFSHDELVVLLEELLDELASAGVEEIDLRVVGGAAIALAHDSEREATQDIDCSGSTDRRAVEAAAAAVAARRSLPADWLNFKVQMFAPDPDHPEPGFEPILARGARRILVGVPSLLLAMKLHAARGRRDAADIETLLDACEVTSIDEAIELYESYYRAEVLKPRAMALLRRRFPA